MYQRDEIRQYFDKLEKVSRRHGNAPRLSARRNGEVGPDAKLRMVPAPGGVAFVKDESITERS